MRKGPQMRQAKCMSRASGPECRRSRDKSSALSGAGSDGTPPTWGMMGKKLGIQSGLDRAKAGIAHRRALLDVSLIARGWSRYDNARAVGQPGSRCASRRNGCGRQAREERFCPRARRPSCSFIHPASLVSCILTSSRPLVTRRKHCLARIHPFLPSAQEPPHQPPPSAAPESFSSARVLQHTSRCQLRGLASLTDSTTHAHRDRNPILPAPWLSVCLLAIGTLDTACPEAEK